MANLIRKTANGSMAETLANAGKNYLNYIDRMAAHFEDPLMDKVYRDTLAKRRIVLSDGCVLQTRRGAINRVIATVPQSVPVVPIDIVRGYQIFIALDIYNDAGASKIGTLLVDLAAGYVVAYHGSVMPASPYFATGDIYGSEFTLDAIPYKEVMGAFTASSDWVSTLSGGSTLRDDPSYYRKIVTGTSKIVNALGVAVSGEYQLIEDTALTFSAVTDISGSTPTTLVNHTSYETYVDDKGFQTKMVTLPDPPGPTQPRYVAYAACPRSISGSTVSTVENFGWINEEDYAFVVSNQVRLYTSNVNFNAATRTTEWYTDGGSDNKIAPVSSKSYYSDSHYLGSWYSGHLIPVVNPFFPEMNVSDSTTETYTIFHNGTAYNLDTVDTANCENIVSHMINYYKYPTGETVVIYAYTKTTADGSQFVLVAIQNGAMWKRTYDYEGSLIHFDDSNIRFCYGDIRMIVSV